MFRHIKNGCSLPWLPLSLRTRRHERGIGLVGSLVLLAVLGVIVTMTARQGQEMFRTFLGGRAGADIARSNDMLQAYINQNQHELIETLAVGPHGALPGVAGAEALQIRDQSVTLHSANLHAIARHLAIKGLADPAQYNAHITLKSNKAGLSPSLTMCRADGWRGCRIDSILYKITPVMRGARPDAVFLNAALQTVGQGGAISIHTENRDNSAAYLRFLHSRGTNVDRVLNPIGNQPGILAVASTSKPLSRDHLSQRGGYVWHDIDMDRHNVAVSKTHQFEIGHAIVMKEVNSASGPIATLSPKMATSNSEFRFHSAKESGTFIVGRIPSSDDKSDSYVTISKGKIKATLIDAIDAQSQTLQFADIAPRLDQPCGNLPALAFDLSEGMIYCNTKQKSGSHDVPRWASLKGKPGAPGKDGTDGADGSNAKT